LLHGREEAEKAARTAAETFAGAGRSDDLPTLVVDETALAAGLDLLQAVVDAGLAASKGEGRRHIKASALKVNDEALTEERPLTPDDLIDGAAKLSIGKKKHALLKTAG
ncbi:MAG: tyrosine--tRNA ligase, partial [Pseudomonadota bacterium]